MPCESRSIYTRGKHRRRVRRLRLAHLLTRARQRRASSANTDVTESPDVQRYEQREPEEIVRARLRKHGYSRPELWAKDPLVWLHKTMRLYSMLTVAAIIITVLLAGEGSANAAPETVMVLAEPDKLAAVIDKLRLWLVAVLAAVATLFFVIGGLRYLTANGDPGELERAKSALKSSAIGYALALLAPLFIGIVGDLFKS